MVSVFILPKCAKTREPKDKHYVSWCTYTYICDTLPLENSKTHLHTALPYITLISYHSINVIS